MSVGIEFKGTFTPGIILFLLRSLLLLLLQFAGDEATESAALDIILYYRMGCKVYQRINSPIDIEECYSQYLGHLVAMRYIPNVKNQCWTVS